MKVPCSITITIFDVDCLVTFLLIAIVVVFGMMEFFVIII